MGGARLGHTASQSKLTELRAEYEYFYFSPKADHLVPLKERSARAHFGQHLLSEDPLREKLLEVLNSRKPMREAQMTSVCCEVSASMDACKRIGEKANGEWAQTLVNERSLLMWERVTKTTKI